MKFLDEPERSHLSEELYEELCVIAEETARKYITSKVSGHGISDLSIYVDLEESNGLNVEVDVELTLSESCKGINEKKLADEAVKVAFEAIDKYVREGKCRSKP